MFYGVRQCPNLKKNLTNERELSSLKKEKKEKKKRTMNMN